MERDIQIRRHLSQDMNGHAGRNWREGIYPVAFRAYGDLNDLLAPVQRHRNFIYRIRSRCSVKDAVEALRIPHVDVALLLINGFSSGWEPIIAAGDRITLYPPGRNLPLEIASRVWEPPPKPIRFVLDVHLGRLAAYLRLLGFDTVYSNHDLTDPVLLDLAIGQSRVLLSQDRKLLMHRRLCWGSVVRNSKPRLQAEEIVERYSLVDDAKPFTRCMACNSELRASTEREVAAYAPEGVRERFEGDLGSFRSCHGCGRVYWPGTHWWRMQKLLDLWKIEQRM